MKSTAKIEARDRQFYAAEIAPVLPPDVLDFHAHVWMSSNWKAIPWQGRKRGGRYMVVAPDYPVARLISDGRKCFPDRKYHAVCFGYPTPAADWVKDTDYVAGAARRNPCLFPLVLGGRELRLTRQDYERALSSGGFYGFKVFLNWYGDDYGDKRIEDMLGPVEMRLANERHLIVMLHVPRSGRLADPVIQRGVRRLACQYPGAQIVLAHCGRCYLPAEMRAAIRCLRGLDNVSMDTSMVMDPLVLQMAINEIGSARLLFATDFPVAAMRGRRVRVMDHWVDVVGPGYPASAYRVAGDAYHAGYMAWEIVLAIRWAAEMTGLKKRDLHGIFWGNGLRMLENVSLMEGEPA